MRVLEHLAALQRWRASGQRFVVATLVAVEGSAPREPGAVMAVSDRGEILGSISGGCVEAAVVQEAIAVLQGSPASSLRFGISDAQAQDVGLSCGGELTILLDEPRSEVFVKIAEMTTTTNLIASALRIDAAGAGRRLIVGSDVHAGSLGAAGLDARVVGELRSQAYPETSIRTYGEEGEPHGSVRVFVQRIVPKPQMYVFGAMDFAASMMELGRFLGYAVTLCDARAAFATAERFPHADHIRVEWPHEFLEHAPVDEDTVIVAFTHDEKFDLPLLKRALCGPARYVGIMGSRRTTALRIEQLRKAGVAEQSLARLCAPVGLDIGARTPQETAVAIAAEIVALRNARSGTRLTGGHGPLRGSGI